jgi:hypothetical protein
MKLSIKIFLCLILFKSVPAQEFEFFGPPLLATPSLHYYFPEILYTGSFGALFRSTDGGFSNKPIFTSYNHWITDIGLPPRDTNRVFMNVYGHSYKSTNKGESWELIYESSYFHRANYFV